MTLPVPDSAVLGATLWVERLLTGSLASTCALLAIAGLGYRLLAGRIELRRAALVVLGIFVLFGAPMMVRELAASVRGDSAAAPDPNMALALTPPPVPTAPPFDPYAGASLPLDETIRD